MQKGNVALYIEINGHNIPAVKIKPIDINEFDSLEHLRQLVALQNLPIAILTSDAWSKLEGFYVKTN